MNGFQWFLHALSHPLTFKGRARRAEYAWFLLAFVVIGIPVELIATETSMLLSYLFYIIYSLPSISLTTRRLHDLGYSGWLQIPFGLLQAYLYTTPSTKNGVYGLLIMWAIVLFITGYLALADGQRKTNQYGPDPKANQI
ncbi:DUF805 domain-containing protein [Haemophilus haemoglobinophilus]|nr:DUF805 domain-containing protein [Canicola haemoglobinophilus]MBN6710880.1 DUF805 domain-containing protein [Canicola haemoglobinophilus]